MLIRYMRECHGRTPLSWAEARVIRKKMGFKITKCWCGYYHLGDKNGF